MSRAEENKSFGKELFSPRIVEVGFQLKIKEYFEKKK
jgi:hypothetical protein